MSQNLCQLPIIKIFMLFYRIFVSMGAFKSIWSMWLHCRSHIQACEEASHFQGTFARGTDKWGRRGSFRKNKDIMVHVTFSVCYDCFLLIHLQIWHVNLTFMCRCMDTPHHK